jgi:hypothetical protein
MNAELDSYSVKDFESLYGVNRSNIYKRLNGLKEKGYFTDPFKQENRAFWDADQKLLMDRLDRHIKTGNDISSFPSAADFEGDVFPVLRDSPRQSHKTQDNLSIDVAPATLGMAAFVDSIVTKLVAVYPPQPQPPDPLANLRQLQEVSDRGWLLSSSQLAPLLGRKSLPSKDFDRFGFRFVKAGKNGAEAAWRVEKHEKTDP